MSRRIDVELTSRRDDGSWTWRAAGAREPRGVVEAELLPGEPKVGDVFKFEIETFIDGIGILSVSSPRSTRAEPQRLELLGPSRPERLVTTTLAPRGRGERDRPRRPRDERGDSGRRDGGRDSERRDRRPRDGDDGARRGRPTGGGGGDRRAPAESKSRLKRLRPGRAHRRELIAELPEEQRPIAEELAKGGIPGVRAALDAQNSQAKAEGKPEINPTPLLALAEELWPRMRTAEWRDRAEAAIAEVDELDLRDLRSVVVAADSAARDDESRALAAQLREALGRRVDEEHSLWLTELAELVAENRIVAALRRSSRPPKAGAPLPSDLAQLLADGTSESLHAEAGTERWSVLLDALSFSPVRSSVTPASLPEHPSDDLLSAVRRAAPRLPQIAALFGIEAAPASVPGRAGRRPAGGGGARSGAGQRRGEKPIPAPPALPADEAPTTTAEGATDAGSAAPEVEAPVDAAADVETPVSVETDTAPEVVAEMEVMAEAVDPPEAEEAPDEVVSEVATEAPAGQPAPEVSEDPADPADDAAEG